MSRRKKMTDNSRTCTCSMCGLLERSLPGTPHRRCGGQKGAAKRSKHSSSAGARGTWQ